MTSPSVTGSPKPRIVFIRTDRLGETVLNLPAIHALRQAYPDARLTFMLHPSLQELLVGHPDLDDTVPEPAISGSWWRRAWRLGRVWRSWHPEIIIISNPKREYHVAAWLAGIPTRVGYARKWGWCLTHRLPDEKALGDCHEVEYNMRLLTVLGIPRPAGVSLRLPVPQEDEQRCAQLLGKLQVDDSDRVVAVHPWTSNPRKQWPVDRCRALIRRLAQHSGVRLVIIGGPEERAKAREVTGEENNKVIDLVGRLSLKELAACLRRVRVLVTNDSGPMHVAAAVGTPVVALFGTDEPGSHPRRWGPWGSGHTVIHKPLEQIAVEEVLQSLQRYL